MIAFRDQALSSSIPVGKIKTLGVLGPKYLVGDPIRTTEDGDILVRIKLVESGEETEYRYSRLRNDPDAR